MGSKRILIVDDQVLVRRLLRYFLASWTSFEVCGEAINGRDAIEKARTPSPDLIVMDYSMSIMNGLEAVAVLKAILPQLPIIMYTVHDTAIMEVQALAVGVRALIPERRHDWACGTSSGDSR
jgi:DNA-binding NarL/FixJ family response regulator